MASSITIRDVPDETHRTLAARAALAGQSLQQYLRSQLIDMAQRPDADTVIARIRARKEAAPTRMPSGKILQYRDADRP